MYAIIKTGGKQYRVKKDDVIDIELLEAELGAQVEFEDVLFVNNGQDMLIGEPSVSGYVVKAEVVGDSAGPKVTSLKYVKRQHWRRKWGHRQHYLKVKILEIGAGGKSSNANASAKKTEVAPDLKEKPKKDSQTKAKSAVKSEAKPKAVKEKKATAESKKMKTES